MKTVIIAAALIVAAAVASAEDVTFSATATTMDDQYTGLRLDWYRPGVGLAWSWRSSSDAWSIAGGPSFDTGRLLDLYAVAGGESLPDHGGSAALIGGGASYRLWAFRLHAGYEVRSGHLGGVVFGIGYSTDR